MIETANTIRRTARNKKSYEVAEMVEGEAASITEKLVTKKRRAAKKLQDRMQEEMGDVKLAPIWRSPYKCVDHKIPSPA